MYKINVKRSSTILFMAGLLFMAVQIAYAGGSVRIINKELPRSGKTSAPLSISYSVPAVNAVNDKVQVVITIKPVPDVAGLTLKISAGEGLSLPDGDTQKNYGDQLRNTMITETVVVTPSTDGVLYLNVFVTGRFNGKQMTRAGAVPIKVGLDNKKMLKKSGPSTTDAKGQKITIMPAEEKK